MKISKKQLKQIIKEEAARVISEVSPFQRRYGKEQFSDPHFVEKGIQKQPTPPTQPTPPAGKDPKAQAFFKVLEKVLKDPDGRIFKFVYESSKGPIVSGIDYIGVYGGQDVIPEYDKKVDDTMPGELVVFMQSETSDLHKAFPGKAYESLIKRKKLTMTAG